MTEKMAKNQHENSTNPRAGVVISDMDNLEEIWPTRCGADYVANLAPARNWNVAATICQMRAGCDVGEVGRAMLADTPLRASRFAAECGVASGVRD